MFYKVVFLFFLFFISFKSIANDLELEFNSFSKSLIDSVDLNKFDFVFLGFNSVEPILTQPKTKLLHGNKEFEKADKGYVIEENLIELIKPRKRHKNEYLVDIVKCVPEKQRSIMAKIVKHESSGNPLAINVNKVRRPLSYRPKSALEATILVETLVDMGFSVDIGYGQINSQHLKPNGFLGKMNVKVEDLFDPCVNLLAGSIVYQKAFNQYGSVEKALSVYNTGNPVDGFKNGYVRKVLSKSYVK